MIRLVVLLDLLYNGSKDQTGIWSLISDVIEGLLEVCIDQASPADTLIG